MDNIKLHTQFYEEHYFTFNNKNDQVVKDKHLGKSVTIFQSEKINCFNITIDNNDEEILINQETMSRQDKESLLVIIKNKKPAIYYISKIKDFKKNNQKTYIVKCLLVDEVRFKNDLSVVSPDGFRHQQYITNFGEKKYVLLGVPIYKEEDSNEMILLSENTVVYLEKKYNEKTTYYSIKTNKGELKKKPLNRVKTSAYRFILMEGNHQFSKNIVPSRSLQTLQTVHERGISDFMRSWNIYEEQDMMHRLKRFKEFKKHVFSSSSLDGGYLTLYLVKDGAKEFILKNSDKNDSFMILADTSFQISQISSYEDISEQTKKSKIYGSIDHNKSKTIIENAVVLEVDENTKKLNEGVLLLSLHGDYVAYKRRANAIKAFNTQQLQIPTLNSIFSDNPAPTIREYSNNINFDLLNQGSFANVNFTDNQLEAIKIIVNTPDIAVVQGPPGTGKTTVIKAALALLNSSTESGDFEFGNNLITSYQSTAVNNVVSGVKIFDLPAVEIKGSKRHEVEESVENSIIEFTESIREKYSDITDVLDQYKRIKGLQNHVLYGEHSITYTISILKEIRKEAEGVLRYSPSLSKLDYEIDRISSNDYTRDMTDLIYTAQKLPTTKEAMEDYGKDVLQKLRINLTIQNKERYKDIINLLDSPSTTPEELKDIKTKLINELQPINPTYLSQSSYDTTSLAPILNSITEELKDRILQKDGTDNDVIYDYLQLFNDNPMQVRKTILKYTNVLGSTVSKSVSQQMVDAKGENSNFETVIIDEAAACPPLEMFIPISKATRRIILVGDHKQLPPVLSDDVLNSIDYSKYSFNESDYRKTLFELMKEKCEVLEAKDGIKRTIMLDNQFRTSPFLGQIISDNIYDKELNSPRANNEFETNIDTLDNKLAVWMNVPQQSNETDMINAAKGEMGARNSTSRIRPLEADRIVKHIRKLIDDETCNGITVGVITGYSLQRDYIKRKLKEANIIEQNGDVIQKERIKRIKVGTIDGFQGQEFDVVYFSLVVTVNNKKPFRPNRPSGKYGFVVSEDRMNVAFSRQKKTLILVGDSKIIDEITKDNKQYEKIHKKKLLGLFTHFYSLCIGGNKYGTKI